MRKFIDFISVFKQEPIKAYTILLNRSEHSYLFLIGSVFGFLLGLNGVINKIFLTQNQIGLDFIVFYIFKTILISFLVLYAYSWIILILNSIFGGYSKQNEIFAVIVYSLVPLTIGSIIISILKLILLSFPGLQVFNSTIFHFLYIVYLIFYILTLIYLVIGNVILNNFSILKSIIATSILPIMGILYEIVKIFK